MSKGKLPRRKKPVTIDGADYIISPLSVDELIKYGEMEEKLKNQEFDISNLTPEQRSDLKGRTAFAVASGLNGATPSLGLTQEDLWADMDDVLLAKLYREIFTFTGMVVPSEEEVQRLVDAARAKRESGEAPVVEGESQASS